MGSISSGNMTLPSKMRGSYDWAAVRFAGE